MQEKKTESLAEDLDLRPGYCAEWDGANIHLANPKGEQVARLPGRALSKEPVEPDGEWQDLCGALLMLANSHSVECEVLRKRVEKLEKRLGEAEAERATSDRIAEDLYEFFSHTAQRVAKEKRAGEEGPNGR